MNLNRKYVGVLLGIPLLLASLLLSGCNKPQASSQGAAPAKPVAEVKKIIEQPKAAYLAGGFQTYSNEAYEKALADGKTVMLDFHASWCGVCVGNSPIIESGFEAMNDQNVVGFKVNYDTENSLINALNIQSQSTLVLLKGNQEIRRTMGPQTAESFMTFIKG